jgi:AcrR family transcriptional regulator
MIIFFFTDHPLLLIVRSEIMGIEARRKRVKELRRQTILKAARKLFFEKGFKNVTVESVAKKADISKGAVYLHFASKEEIYTQILLNDTDKHQKQITGIIKKSGQSSIESLLLLAQSYVDFFLNDRELFRIFMNYMLHTDHMNLPEELDKQIVKAVNRNVDVITEALQQGIDAGEFSSSMNLLQHRNAIWGLLNGVIALHLFTGPEARREVRIRTTIQEGLETYLEGLRVANRAEKKGNDH